MGKYRSAVHCICNLRFNVSNEFSVFFHNESYCDYHFFMKELANKFKDEFECFAENTEKYKNVSVPIEKEIRKADRNGNEDLMKDLWHV